MKPVFVDVDTQLDFLYPAGALYVPGAEHVVPAISSLNRLAAEHGIPVLSTTDAHTESDPEFANWPPHCIAGTTGQHKPESTLLAKRIVIPNRDGEVTLQDAQQLIVEKQTTDVFLTHSIGRILEALNADRFVVYGVVTEVCVLAAARGLLKAGKKVTVVTDAIQTLKPEDSDRALAEIHSAGGELTTVSQLRDQV